MRVSPMHSPAISPTRARPLPATGRLGMVSAWFKLIGAGLSFLAMLVPLGAEAHLATWELALAGVGLILLASVWRHLD